jgi:cytochrome c oxidase accessory protein FixG
MWIERKVEGDRFARIRLDGEEWPWGLRKWRIKISKHVLWILIALWTGFTFVGYFTPIKVLSAELIAFTLGPWQAFWLLFYSFATWGNAGFMREQVCKYMCPYARFQSVMVDKDTFVVTYDKTRGDPRGSRSKAANHKELGLGDCVDCNICVQVCPTGIDIRDGLQYMCIGCGACIDACDQVMDKVGYDKGLIRYTSERAMLEHMDNKKARHYIFRPRVLIYIGIMFVLLTAFASSVFLRNPLRVDVMRDRGALAREVEGTKIENVYRLQIMNSSENPMRVSIVATGLPGMKILSSQGKEITELVVNPSSNLLIPVKVRVAIDDVNTGTHPISFDIEATESGPNASSALRVRDERSSFIVPR